MNVLITDHGFASIETERAVIEAAGASLHVAQCRSADELIEAAAGADALLVQWCPVTEAVLATLTNCKVIVRYGIGLDNVDLAAARRHGVAVCNVPDYCLDEVADHTLAMALSLARQLPQIDDRLRGGTWKITPDRPMAASRHMTFATAGYGRIARNVLARARAFGFQLAAYDPYVDESTMAAAGVKKLAWEELLASANILSLHLPLTSDTKHLMNAATIAQLPAGAIVVNTARGSLVDTISLAAALQSGHLGGAGLDVFEEEPLAADHPLRGCANAVLTSHVAWYSEASVPELQRKAAEEVVRALRGEPLKYPAN